MSNHFSAAYLNFPGGDTRLDFTDLFVFAPDGDLSDIEASILTTEETV